MEDGWKMVAVAVMIGGPLLFLASTSQEGAPASGTQAAAPPLDDQEAAAVMDVVVTDGNGKRWTAHAYELDNIMRRGWHISVDELQTSKKGIPVHTRGRLTWLPAAEAEAELMSERGVAWTNGKSPERRRFEAQERANVAATASAR